MANSEFVTVKKSDPAYKHLINGASADGRLALPVESLSMRKENQWATFELKENKAAAWTSRASAIFQGLRPRYLSMTLTAPLICWAELYDGEVFWFLPLSILLALAFLHFSIFLFNDYKDHSRGIDLNQAGRARGIIQRGWVSAGEVRAWAFVNFVLGALCAVPALMERPVFVLAMGSVVIVTFLALSELRPQLGRFGLNEFLVSLSLGPLLAYGFSEVVFGKVSIFSLALCMVFGWLASLVFQAKYLEEMVFTFQNRRPSLMGKLGFDRSKRFVSLQLIIMPLLTAAGLLYYSQIVLVILLPSSLTILAWLVISRIQKSPSPMSSRLGGLSRTLASGHIIVAMLTVLLMVATKWL